MRREGAADAGRMARQLPRRCPRELAGLARGVGRQSCPAARRPQSGPQGSRCNQGRTRVCDRWELRGLRAALQARRRRQALRGRGWSAVYRWPGGGRRGGQWANLPILPSWAWGLRKRAGPRRHRWLGHSFLGKWQRRTGLRARWRMPRAARRGSGQHEGRSRPALWGSPRGAQRCWRGWWEVGRQNCPVVRWPRRGLRGSRCHPGHTGVADCRHLHRARAAVKVHRRWASLRGRCWMPGSRCPGQRRRRGRWAGQPIQSIVPPWDWGSRKQVGAGGY